MRSFVFRILSLGTRFLAPILVLRLSSSEMLGKYYLFVTFCTSAVFFISFEMASPFSRRYLAMPSPLGRRKVFQSLVTTQMVVASAIGLPALSFFGFAGLHSGSLLFLPLVYLYLILEAGVNEVGRFYWNIGEVAHASLRDLLRSIFFAVGVILSVYLTGNAIGSLSLTIIIFANAGILVFELSRHGSLKPRIVPFGRTFRRFWRLMSVRVNLSVRESGIQLLHLQILTAVPLLERMLLEIGLGLAVVGAYSFQFSLISAGVSLLLLPSIAVVRRMILSPQRDLEDNAVHRSAAILFAKVSAVCLLVAAGTYVAIPILRMLLHKNIETTPLMTLLACASAIASIFAGAISPLFAGRERVFRGNFWTVIGILPLPCGYMFMKMGFVGGASFTFSVAAFAAVLQMAPRLLFLMKGNFLFNRNSS